MKRKREGEERVREEKESEEIPDQDILLRHIQPRNPDNGRSRDTNVSLARSPSPHTCTQLEICCMSVDVSKHK